MLVKLFVKSSDVYNSWYWGCRYHTASSSPCPATIPGNERHAVSQQTTGFSDSSSSLSCERTESPSSNPRNESHLHYLEYGSLRAKKAPRPTQLGCVVSHMRGVLLCAECTRPAAVVRAIKRVGQTRAHLVASCPSTFENREDVNMRKKRNGRSCTTLTVQLSA